MFFSRMKFVLNKGIIEVLYIKQYISSTMKKQTIITTFFRLILHSRAQKID